jgi:rubredoxin
VAGAGGPEAGEILPCPSCGAETKQKAMIPILHDGVKAYVCVACARAFIPPEGSPARA